MSTFSQTSEELEGVPTDVVIQPFADQILVLITQLGKVGNLVRIQYQPACIMTDEHSGSVDTSHNARHSTSATFRATSKPIRAVFTSPIAFDPAYSVTRASAVRTSPRAPLTVCIADCDTRVVCRSGGPNGPWQARRDSRGRVETGSGRCARGVERSREEGVSGSDEDGEESFDTVMKSFSVRRVSVARRSRDPGPMGSLRLTQACCALHSS